MRNHSQSSRKTMARLGKSAMARPGRRPFGAKNNARKPASSSIPSDWYPENSPAALTKDRKHTKQTSRAPRGTMLAITSNDATIPTQHKAIKECDPLEHQSSVGADQNRAEPAERAITWRNSFAGRIPTGPIKPRI